MIHRDLCACGRDAIEALRVASDDGLLLIPVCADCIEAGDAELCTPSERRRPLTAMPARDDPQQQPPLPLGDQSDVDEEQGAA